jgi:hypothetical protein
MRSESEVRARELLAAEFRKVYGDASETASLYENSPYCVDYPEFRAVIAALASQGEQQGVEDERFPGGLADAVVYVNQMEEAAAGLFAQVLGYENDGSDTGTDLIRHVEEALAARQLAGEIVITKDEAGNILAVTRQVFDKDDPDMSESVKVLAEAPPAQPFDHMGPTTVVTPPSIWNDHKIGIMPVTSDTVVEVQFRSGETAIGPAGVFNWSDYGEVTIVSYRLV